MKRVLAAVVLAVSLTACSEPPQPVQLDPAVVEANYERCLEAGGSFTQEATGFACTL